MAKTRPEKSTRQPREHWKDEPEAHDFPAATDYLSLVAGDAEARALVEELQRAPLVRRKAKDLLRASRLALLDESDPHVATDLVRIRKGERLSPVLLVRGSATRDVALIIADGYHRVCASYHVDEDALIPCRLADPDPRPPGPGPAAPVAARPGQREPSA